MLKNIKIQKKIDNKNKHYGQVMLEFTFCMIILFFMMYGVIMIFRWTGVDLAERRRAHNTALKTTVIKDWVNIIDGPLGQMSPYFFDVLPMNATLSPY